MAKRLSEKQKDEIVRSFTEGKNIDILSSEFNCNKLTISRNLKKYLGEKKYKDLIKKNKLQNQEKDIENSTTTDINKELYKEELINKNQFDKKMQNYEDFNFNKFTEITPLNELIDNNSRKDFSSIPIAEIDLPKIVYMIVSEKIDLETKLLKDYVQWHFLSESELNRKTIEIYLDIKNAKRFCKTDQKVIKVPNTKVFTIVAPILVSRGISRMIFEENLIAF